MAIPVARARRKRRWALRQRLPVRMQARKGGQQRWVDVDHAPRPGLHEPGGEDPHVAAQRDEFDARLAMPLVDFVTDERLALYQRTEPEVSRCDIMPRARIS